MAKPAKGSRKGNMVLRTVYLPEELDEDLKNVALLAQSSKNDVIRSLIVAGLAGERDKVKAKAKAAASRAVKPAKVAPASRYRISDFKPSDEALARVIEAIKADKGSKLRYDSKAVGLGRTAVVKMAGRGRLLPIPKLTATAPRRDEADEDYAS